jgi:hypothetical protein
MRVRKVRLHTLARLATASGTAPAWTTTATAARDRCNFDFGSSGRKSAKDLAERIDLTTAWIAIRQLPASRENDRPLDNSGGDAWPDTRHDALRCTPLRIQGSCCANPSSRRGRNPAVGRAAQVHPAVDREGVGRKPCGAIRAAFVGRRPEASHFFRAFCVRVSSPDAGPRR